MKTAIRRVVSILLSITLIFNMYMLTGPTMAKAASMPTASSVFKNMGAGWNLGNSLDSHYAKSAKAGEANLGQETIWGNPRVSQQQIDYVASLGFKTIRVPVTWYTHVSRDGNGVLHINQDWLNRVKEVVNYCIADDLYVIINTHHDESIIYTGVKDSEFNKVKADAAALWSEIAAAFKDTDGHLIFESYNEVDNNEKYWQFGKKAASQMNELNQVFVDTVRSTGGRNAERVLMVPTLLDGRTSEFIDAFEMPSDTVSDRILVTVHCYSQQYDQSIEAVFTEIQKLGTKTGARVVIGEWGTKDVFAPGELRSVHAGNYVARAAAHGLGCIYWDNGSNYAIIDRNDLNCNEEMVKAIINPKAYVADGQDVTFTEKDFLYKTINQKTGELKEDKNWGTIILGPDGSGQINIPDGSTNLYMQLTRSGTMATQAYHYVYFFDGDNNLLGNVNDWSGFTDKSVNIPSGARYVRIGINSAQTATSKTKYTNGFKNGEIIPYVRFR